jgi:oxepin-CoA hydrolase/3-oxo-5,6-dehydrosuberyl-CoA semialdehyde dehydrogenase
MTSQDVLAFTGSADTGLLLRSRENLLRQSVAVNVEADSLNAAVLGPDVSPGSETWNLFLFDVYTDMTQKVGQKCTAIRRIFVPSDSVDAVQADLAARLAAAPVGNPASNGVVIGPLASKSQLDEARKGIAQLATEADIVCGTTDEPSLVDAESGKGWFLGPVLLRARDSATATVVHRHEVFGPVATLLPWAGDAETASELVRKGDGSLVCSVYSDDRAFVRDMVLGIGTHHGRIYLGSEKVAGQALGPGAVLPGSIHGGPGRAGGGEELGGLRGLRLYQQRVALQGDRAVVERLFPRPATRAAD